MTAVPAPIGLLAELTHRCPLQCPYCSNPIALEPPRAELSTTQWLDVLDQAAGLGICQVHLSGGEPTVRRDLEQLVASAARLGLYSNLITSGFGVKRERLAALASAGLDHVQISIQDATARSGDRIAGASGAHARKVELAGFAQELGLALTINAPVHRQNIDHLEDIIEFALALGARRLEVANVQYYGWALKNRATLLPTRDQVASSVIVVEQARERFKGVLNIDYVAPDYYASRPKACMGGWGRGVINVTPSGKALPCHAAETIPSLSFENVTLRPLREIWTNSQSFNAFRGTGWMREPCRTCELREVDWGGCRCQAMAITGDAANTDPMCAKSPRHGEIALTVAAAVDKPPPDLVPRRPLAGRGRS